MLNRSQFNFLDILSDVLNKVKLSSVVYFKSDFPASWGMDIPASQFAQFHIVTRGQCVLKSGRKIIQLFAGDVVIFPFGASHWLADSRLSSRRAGDDVVQSLMSGNSIFQGESVSATLICGHFEFDRKLDHPFIRELPEMIHICDSERKELPWLEGVTDILMQEAGGEKPGSDIIVNRLGEVLFIHTLRAFILSQKERQGFTAAMKDEKISKAVRAIHNTPEGDWKLSSLAQIAGMSRTAFSTQFKELIGQTPIDYITRWRVIQAQELLRESDKMVGEIAQDVGYQSEAAFNRVFKKRVNQTPLKYRQSLSPS